MFLLIITNRMSKYIVLIISTLPLFSNCISISEENNSDNMQEDELVVIIDKNMFDNAPSDHVDIQSFSINNNVFSITFSASGCSGSSWELKLITDGSILESNPPQRNLRLSLNNNELCEAYITKELSFDISGLKTDGNKLILNLINSDSSIIYEY